MASETTEVTAMTADALLQHWQVNRRLTRRTIEAFPEDKLFRYAVGGMRPFGVMACESISMTMPTVTGVATGVWAEYKDAMPATKAEMLQVWDKETAHLADVFRQIPQARFSEVDTAFGQWTMTGIAMILYVIDNEIHHRGQGYVYLRTLGIEPPPFWER